MQKSAKNPAFEAKQLEKSYKLKDIVKQRDRTLTNLDLKPGEKVFDIGCGVGFLSYDMALLVGNKGEVIGLDKNAEMISGAKKRCKNLSQARFYVGDATNLSERNQYFDAVSCTQVLLYVNDVSKVISEIKRILKPGGRVIIVETDWRGVVLNSMDDNLTRKIFSAWDSAVPSPNLPSHLGPLLKKNGFSKVEVDAVPILNTEYSSRNFSYEMMKWISKNAVKQKVFNERERTHWISKLEELERSGSYFFCVNRFIFLAKS